MSRQPRPAVIGTFVLLAVFLLLGMIVLLGSERFFRHTETCVMYFESSVSGLDIGAPVEFQGVRVGDVSKIVIVYNPDSNVSRVPVYVKIEPSAVEYEGSGLRDGGIERMIASGLRAQLQSQSILTGKLKVQLVRRPEAPARLVGDGSGLPEIPTVLPVSEALARRVEDLPLEDMVRRSRDAVDNLARMLESESATNLLVSVKASSDEVGVAMKRLAITLDSVDRLIAEQSPVRYEAQEAISEMGRAATALRQLVEQLQEEPESLLRGRKDVTVRFK